MGFTGTVDIGHGCLAVSVEQSVACQSSLNKFLPIVQGIAPGEENAKECIACPAATPGLL